MSHIKTRPKKKVTEETNAIFCGGSIIDSEEELKVEDRWKTGAPMLMMPLDVR